MPEIRQDPTTREWVIIATERAKRPHEFTSLSSAADQASRSCVFCRGNESQTPPEVWRLEGNGQWRIRVVGNKFPALSSKATATRYETPPFYRSMDGFGYHEVIVETPEHDQTLASMQEDELVDVLLTYRERHLALKADPRVKSVLSEQEVTSHIRIHRSLLHRLYRVISGANTRLPSNITTILAGVYTAKLSRPKIDTVSELFIDPTNFSYLSLMPHGSHSKLG